MVTTTVSSAADLGSIPGGCIHSRRWFDSTQRHFYFYLVEEGCGAWSCSENEPPQYYCCFEFEAMVILEHLVEMLNPNGTELTKGQWCSTYQHVVSRTWELGLNRTQVLRL
jgi:hypothetical protein